MYDTLEGYTIDNIVQVGIRNSDVIGQSSLWVGTFSGNISLAILFSSLTVSCSLLVSRCCQIAAFCSQTSSLWLLRRGTNNFSDAVTEDCDKLQEIFKHQLSPQRLKICLKIIFCKVTMILSSRIVCT